MSPSRPLLLCCSGHDPTGGAGIHADIESAAANGAHALTVITAQTVQDTRNVSRVVPTAPILLAAQLEALLADCEVRAIKIGLIGDAAQIPPLLAAIRRAQVPVVLDPVLRAGGGRELLNAAAVAALRADLLPAVDLLTPNAAEARRLAPEAATLADCGAALLKLGCRNVLITGGDEPGDPVVNTWFGTHGTTRFEWPRLPGGFHGAGCTLAAAIAARLAGGETMEAALGRAQEYTQRTLAAALRIGEGRAIPDRRA